MSDIMAALLILPLLFALVVVLECTRLGCAQVSRRLRRPARSMAAPDMSREAPMDTSTETVAPLQSL